MSSRFTFCIRHKSSQACSAARAINKGRRRIIKVLPSFTILHSNTLHVVSRCWSSCWLSTTCAGAPGSPPRWSSGGRETPTFHSLKCFTGKTCSAVLRAFSFWLWILRFSIMAKHLPTIHATINPFIYWWVKFLNQINSRNHYASLDFAFQQFSRNSLCWNRKQYFLFQFHVSKLSKASYELENIHV